MDSTLPPRPTLAQLPALAAQGWWAFRHDPMVAWNWRRIRLFALVGFAISLAQMLLAYVQNFLIMNEQIDLTNMTTMLGFAALGCLSGITTLALLVAGVFVYPGWAYRRSFSDNDELRFAPISFIERQRMILLPILVAYLLFNLPGILPILFPQWAFGLDLAVLRPAEPVPIVVKTLDHILLIIYTLMNLAVSSLTYLGMAQRTLNCQGRWGTNPFRSTFYVLRLILPFLGMTLVVGALVAWNYTHGSGMTFISLEKSIGIDLAIYAVVIALLLLVVSLLVKLLHRDMVRSHEILYQPME
jgi:hypothetical protein